MTFALSTNWNNQRLTTGEEIVDEALALGFDELELGFNTTPEQVIGFRARLGEMPVGSVHAFCPVPLSAPHGYPELYQLADPEEDARRIARVHVVKNIEFAASMGASAVVLHAGRVPCRTFYMGSRLAKRARLGQKRLDVFRRELDVLLPTLEKNGVVLGLENLPYLEGFPNEVELASLSGDWVRAWLDTGHQYVRETKEWCEKGMAEAYGALKPIGLHINDSVGGDDHLPPGEGKVDFAALKSIALAARHRVLEPHADVTADALRTSLVALRQLWS